MKKAIKGWSTLHMKRSLRWFGPPNEWSGAVAAAIGPEKRRALRVVWEGMSPAERRATEEAFKRNFDRG